MSVINQTTKESEAMVKSVLLTVCDGCPCMNSDNEDGCSCNLGYIMRNERIDKMSDGVKTWVYCSLNCELNQITKQDGSIIFKRISKQVTISNEQYVQIKRGY